MKKLFCLLLSLLLLRAFSACAQERYALSAGGTPLASVSYDDSLYRLDSESYWGSSGGGHIWLGLFYSDQYSIDCMAERYDDLPLTDANDADLLRLSNYLCTALTGDGCTAIGRYDGALPFMLFSMQGKNGSSYYAATITQGYVLHFEIYSMRSAVDQNALTALKTFLNGVN